MTAANAQTAKRFQVIDVSLDARELNLTLSGIEAPYVAIVFNDTDVPEEYFNSLADLLDRYPDCNLASGKLATAEGKALSLEQGFPRRITPLNAAEDYSYGLLYPEGTLCRTDELKKANLTFSESLEFCRDEAFAMALSLAFPTRLYHPAVEYRSKRVFDETSNNTPQSNEAGWYWEAGAPLVEALGYSGADQLPLQVQYGLLYLIIQRFISNENMAAKMVFADEPETLEYLDAVSRSLRQISNPVLFSGKPAIAWTRPKLLYLAHLRSGDDDSQFSIDTTGDTPTFVIGDDGNRAVVELFGYTRLIVQTMNYRDDGETPGLEVFARFPTCFPEADFSIVVRSSFEGENHDYAAERTSILGARVTFFNQIAHVVSLYRLFVPLPSRNVRQTITAHGVVNGKEYPLQIGFLDINTNRVRENYPGMFWSIPRFAVRSVDWTIDVRPAGMLKKAVDELRYDKTLWKGTKDEHKAAKIRLAYHLTKPFLRNKRTWVYYDKGFKGGDNGEFAFRYAAAQNDGIRHVYFIDPSSADGKRLAEEGYDILKPHYGRNTLPLLQAEVIYCTHNPAYNIPGIKNRRVRYFKDLMDATVIRMYHGFTLTYDPSYAQPSQNSAAVVVSSRYEHALYANPVHGFTDDQIIDCGMPRHDGLASENKRQILFAPTWRPSLRGKGTDSGASAYNPDFKESRYFQHYNQIFNDERLLDCARRTGFKLKLFLHPRLAAQTADFEGNDVFEAIDCTKDSDYVTMMRTSDLMVTDFSSVMVDFAYARKPVVYYQDPALPYWRYYNFDYENIGFGEVAKSINELVELLCEYMENDCALKDFYRKRIDDFFFYDDPNCSKRLYEHVRKMTD